MIIKDDTVNIWGLELPMQRVLKCAAAIWSEKGEELVITSARDGMHSAGSLHYYGLAVDLRSRYFDKQTQVDIVDTLRSYLGEDYDVIHHSTHIHVEYDRKS